MKKFLITFIILIGAVFAVWNWRMELGDWYFNLRKNSLPVAQNYNQIVNSENTDQVENINIPKAEKVPSGVTNENSQAPQEQNEAIETETPQDVSGEINLNIPFTSQAPNANWDAVHEEACEEASMLMVDAYFDGRVLGSAEEIDRELLDVVNFENNLLGFSESTTAEETARIIRGFYGYKQVDVVYDFSADDIRRYILDGLPVILPAYGRALENPYFRQPGPLYHMLVVRGFTSNNKFITNDPGTRRGEEYVYDENVLMNAVHDWNGGDVENGKKVMIIVYPN